MSVPSAGNYRASFAWITLTEVTTITNGTTP
jgi:hypothetical protein